MSSNYSKKNTRKSIRYTRKKKIGYKIYNPENPSKINLIKTFNQPSNIYGGRTFMEEYPFVDEECVKNNVWLMTIEEFIVFKSKTIDRNRLKTYTEAKFKNSYMTRENKKMLDILGNNEYPIGLLDQRFTLYKKYINIGKSGQTVSLNQLQFIRKFIDDLLDEPKDLYVLLKDNNFDDLYNITVTPIEEDSSKFGIGTAKDCLTNEFFKEYIKDNLLSRFNDMCKRNDKSLISSDYVQQIIEANIDNIMNEEGENILICLVNKEDNKILSFVCAEANPNFSNDIIGELICTSQGTSGLGKLQMASTILLARDSNVSFVFIQAIEGYMGVQAGLYSKLGFESDFKNYPEIMEKEFAIRELTQVKYEYLRQRGGIFKSPHVMFAKTSQAIGLLPMWIYAPSVNTKCMENIIKKTGWDCRVGNYGGEGGQSKYLSYLPYTTPKMQRYASTLSKVLGKDYSHAREASIASQMPKSRPNRSRERDQSRSSSPRRMIRTKERLSRSPIRETYSLYDIDSKKSRFKENR